ncbi:MAG TPA: hypothetical protein VFX50_16155 [Gemmatimonadales bacterium]|nr:hypothetical protein [Gemmatimonadales bacterium]
MRGLLPLMMAGCAIGVMGWTWGPSLAQGAPPLASLAPGTDLSVTLLDGRRVELDDAVVEGNIVRGFSGPGATRSCDVAERALCDSLDRAHLTRVGVAEIRSVERRPDYATPGFLMITIGLLMLGAATAMSATRRDLEIVDPLDENA